MFSRGHLGEEDVSFLKPTTFMNLSGQSVQPAAAFLKVPVERVVVVYDEIDLPFGEVRIKKGGGHGGHNGIRSLLERLGYPSSCGSASGSAVRRRGSRETWRTTS